MSKWSDRVRISKGQSSAYSSTITADDLVDFSATEFQVQDIPFNGVTALRNQLNALLSVPSFNAMAQAYLDSGGVRFRIILQDEIGPSIYYGSDGERILDYSTFQYLTVSGSHISYDWSAVLPAPYADGLFATTTVPAATLYLDANELLRGAFVTVDANGVVSLANYSLARILSHEVAGHIFANLLFSDLDAGPQREARAAVFANLIMAEGYGDDFRLGHMDGYQGYDSEGNYFALVSQDAYDYLFDQGFDVSG